MSELTPREWTLYTFIVAYFRQHNYPPSIIEISAAIGREAGGGIKYTLTHLDAKGVIRYPTGKARCISVCKGIRVGVQP